MAKVSSTEVEQLTAVIQEPISIVGATDGLYVTFAKLPNGVVDENKLRVYDKEGHIVHSMDFKESFAYEVTDEMLLLIVLERLRIKNEKNSSAPKIRAMNGVALALQKLEQEKNGSQIAAVHGTTELP